MLSLWQKININWYCSNLAKIHFCCIYYVTLRFIEHVKEQVKIIWLFQRAWSHIWSIVTIWILNTWIPDNMGVQYSNGKVMWLHGPFEYRIFWTINRLFQSDFQTTIWIPNHLTTGHNLPFKYQTSQVFKWLLQILNIAKCIQNDVTTQRLGLASGQDKPRPFYYATVFKSEVHNSNYFCTKLHYLSRV